MILFDVKGLKLCGCLEQGSPIEFCHMNSGSQCLYAGTGKCKGEREYHQLLDRMNAREYAEPPMIDCNGDLRPLKNNVEQGEG